MDSMVEHIAKGGKVYADKLAFDVFNWGSEVLDKQATLVGDEVCIESPSNNRSVPLLTRPTKQASKEKHYEMRPDGLKPGSQATIEAMRRKLELNPEANLYE